MKARQPTSSAAFDPFMRVHSEQMTAMWAKDVVRATLAGWIPRGAEVAIVDVPVHRNAGDLFILAATAHLLAELECRVVYRAGIRDYRASRAGRQIRPGTVLIGLGGGNFGDVYPRYQDLRERVVADFPRNRIVILPQTIHFADRRARDRATNRLGAHPDLRIAVRDRTSLETARAFTPHVELLPDLVHALVEDEGSEANAARADGTVFLMRRDREGNPASARKDRSVDWPDIFPELFSRLALAAAVMPAAPAWLSTRVHDRWTGYAGDLLCRGLAWMRGVDHLVTDRLHAAILARLAGRRVTLHDPAYGKLAAYYDAWWRDDPAVQLRRQ